MDHRVASRCIGDTESLLAALCPLAGTYYEDPDELAEDLIEVKADWLSEHLNPADLIGYANWLDKLGETLCELQQAVETG